MIVKDAIKKASLTLSHLDNPQKEARILLSHCLGCSLIDLTLYDTKEVDESFFKLVDQRAKDIPIEYLTNRVSFYSEDFFIDYGALIPRPESELLIDEVLKLPLGRGFTLAEIGVGSGVLSIMISRLTDAKVVATDISRDAIKIAKKNIELFSLQDKIELYHTSYLDGVNGDFDIIISNPPYIKDALVLDKNLSYEPQNALYGGEVGNEILKEIVDLALKKRPKYLVCEMGYDQKDSMSRYFDTKDIKEYFFYKDLSGFDRGFVCQVSTI